MSWRHPATPLSCRGDQALAAGSETRRRSVDGRVCLRNSPRPCESRSHLSGSPSANVGLVPPAWQWHLGGEVVNKHLSIGSPFVGSFCSFAVSCYLLSANLSSPWPCSRQGFCHAPPWSSSSSCASACPLCRLGSELPWPGRFLLPSSPSHLCFLPLLAPSFLIPFPFPCFFPVTFLSP